MFHINYCEFNRSNKDFDKIYRPYGSGDYLVLLFKTPMKCYLNDQLTVSRENACLVYTPGTCQNYQAVQKFRNSYVHFSTDLPILKNYEIPENQLLYPSAFFDLDTLIQEIQKEYLFKAPYYEERCRILMEDFFALLSRSLLQSKEKSGPEFSEFLPAFQKIRLRMLQNLEEDWSVERLCRESHLSKSQFFYYYKLFFLTSPKSELLQARMEKAKALLTNEALQVQTVARLCGFSNIEHFSRYFSARYHCSPRDFREQQHKLSL